MGSLCCCMQVEEIEDYLNRNSSFYRNCVCVNCFLHNFLNVYSAVFGRGGRHAIPSSIETSSSMTSTASFDDSFSDMFHSPPRPLPYDADPRSFGLVSRREKGSSHSPEESELVKGKWHDYSHEGRLEEEEEESIKSSVKLAVGKENSGHGYTYSTIEDEDVCPICLEEYTPENPKIMTKCSHHFHLGCMYEWMERSDNCPVCGKVMLFDETT